MPKPQDFNFDARERSMKLTGKWVVITGGSSGIGFAIASALSKRNNRVTLVAENEVRLRDAKSKLDANGANVDVIRCDFGAAGQIDALSDEILSAGAPDVLINNAGFAVYRSFEASDTIEIDRLLDVNLIGHVKLTKRLLAPMVARRSGAICFMASIAGRLPITPNAMYCGAKHGMLGLASALREELKRFNIEVTAICPGRVETPFFDHETFRSRQKRPETKGIISAQRVADSTLRSIERNYRVTYVPGYLQAISWAFETFPFVLRPLYNRVVRSRIEGLYAANH